MTETRIKVPEDIKSFLEVENCSDFNENRYFIIQEQVDLIKEILRMRNVTEEIRNVHKIGYLNSTLLYGPTGTGKTTLCKFIAYKLNLDFAYVNFAKVVDGMFGNTARNIDKVFKFMADNECVFVLDEIDCIATKRGSESAASGGELSRITITLMQELDYYKSHKVNSIIIGCTNVVDLLDPALRSRFAMEKEIRLLKNDEKKGFCYKYLDDVGVPYDKKNIDLYCSRNNMVTQRKMESDMIRAIARWLLSNKEEPFVLKNIEGV